MDIYLVGFHPMKDHPDAADGSRITTATRSTRTSPSACCSTATARNANLTGIEYIVSERIFDTLPAEERAFWHPHNAEILSGQLVAPGIPEVAEKALMKSKMNSYGKTWHVWDTGASGQGGDTLPLGRADAGLVVQPRRRGEAGTGRAARPVDAHQQRATSGAGVPTCSRWPGRNRVSTT